MILWVNPAVAEEGEVSIGAGPTVSTWTPQDSVAERWAPGVAVDVAWWLTDFWSLAARIGTGLALEAEESRPLAHGQLEGRYVLDALTWVPWACVGTSGLWLNGSGAPDQDLVWSAHAGVGIDYRPSRRWSFALETRFHASLEPWRSLVGPLELGLVARMYLD